MAQETDTGRMLAALNAPAFRYRSFGNQPVRAATAANRASSAEVSPTEIVPGDTVLPVGSSKALSFAEGIENLLKMQPEMENPFTDTLIGEAPPDSSAAPPTVRSRGTEKMPAMPPGDRAALQGLASALRVSPPPAMSLPGVSPLPSPAVAEPASQVPLGDAASLLAALRAAEVRETSSLPPPLLSALGTLPSPAAALPAAPLLAALAPAPMPPPMSPPMPSPTPAAEAAAPAKVGDILRRLGQPPAASAAATPPEKMLPEVLRALRLRGLG